MTTPRYVTDHKVNSANDRLTIAVTDSPGAGNANHRYEITGVDEICNPSGKGVAYLCTPNDPIVLLFQNGPIAEAGLNGITQEALLAIVADRLRSFQEGQFKCRENALALTKIEEAMHWLHARTLARMQRGVEGTHTV